MEGPRRAAGSHAGPDSGEQLIPTRWDKLTVFRGVWGAVLLVRPQLVLARLNGDSPARIRVAARILGARHLGEAVAVGLWPDGSPPPRWSAAIDVVHALSMLMFASFVPRIRRDAVASAGMSSALAAISALERRQR